MVDVKTCCAEVYAETNEIWQEVSKNSGFVKENGYAVLNSPPISEPSSLIISLQPGKTSDNHYPNTWPTFNNYCRRRSSFAKSLSRLFDKLETQGGPTLESSMAAYFNFFRAPKKKIWICSLEKNTRIKCERFSNERMLRIVCSAQPKTIFAIGVDVFDAL